MGEVATRASFFRGGTSKAVFFKAEDLPIDAETRDRLLLHVLGSPDPYGRQLNGLGGGISSLSKAMWVQRSDRNDADVDYTFAQISVDKPEVDYAANCGNMTSAVAPFAVEDRIFPVADGEAMVRLYNTNTGVVVHASFEVRDGRAVTEGGLEIPGVAGTGAPMRLAFQDPLGDLADNVLPTGNLVDTLDVPDVGAVDVTIFAAAAVCVFIDANRLAKNATEAPTDLDADRDFMDKMEAIRRHAAVHAGLAPDLDDVAPGAPKMAIIAAPGTYVALDQREFTPDQADIAVRMDSMGNIHKAVPLTGAMCLAAASKIPGTIPNGLIAGRPEDIRIATPSGILTMSADVTETADGWKVRSTTALRTFRRLMQGMVFHPG